MPLLVLVALVIAAGYAAAAAFRLPRVMSNLWYGLSYRLFAQTFLLPLPFAFFFIRLTARGADGRWLPGIPGWKLTWARYRERYLNVGRLIAAAIAGLAVAATINVFGVWKLNISRINPFSWDVRFTDLDRALHGGRLPWEWLQPLLGHPPVTTLLESLYYAWLPLMLVVCAWQAWSPRRDLRMRFFISFVLVLILLGDVAAAIFSSAGPCYYARVVGAPDPYASLLTYHAQIASFSPLVQQELWRHYIGAVTTPYTGISAFPSIHVAIVTLYLLLGWSLWRPLGVLFGAYALAVELGSIHLGWHYGVDGYAGVAGTAIIWWASGIIVRRFGGPAVAPTTAPTERSAA